MYGKAPYFSWLYPELERYLNQDYRWLIDLCWDGHQCLGSLLQISTPVAFSSELGFKGLGKTERLVALCDELKGNHYIATNASANYLDPELFEQAKIKLSYQNYDPKEYSQTLMNDTVPAQRTHISHLSVVDLMMFAGPEAKQIISHTPLFMRYTSTKKSKN
ncbi:WbqC-like family protein [Oleiphilus messinensis]|uniref:WbqC-like family protein n=1 Tax=Oleiphilus messinensis TaxID=141451 RepID=A0A1Y0IJA5_9GAMM|nr:WbqC-like family protein [Oleiphilus messinensis]